MVAVTGRIEGRGMGAAVADVKRVLARAGMLAPGIRYELGGLYQQQQIAFAGLHRVRRRAGRRVRPAAVPLRAVLAGRHHHRLSAAIDDGRVRGSGLTGVELNITALMGMTMIIGIGTEMAIFYVSEWMSWRGTLPPRALREPAATACVRSP